MQLNRVDAVFLDRDGVINELIYHEEAGIIDSPFAVDQFKLLPHVGAAIKLLNQNNIKVIVVSNQPGIAKNHFTKAILEKTTDKLKENWLTSELVLMAFTIAFTIPKQLI